MTHLERLDSILLWYRIYIQMKHPQNDAEGSGPKTDPSQSGTSMEADYDRQTSS